MPTLTRREWHKFYGILRGLSQSGGGINMFPADFNTALRIALHGDTNRVTALNGWLSRFWHLALSVYGTDGQERTQPTWPVTPAMVRLTYARTRRENRPAIAQYLAARQAREETPP